jgi:predicted ribosome quality control (RQC) complex YloA/Tae2 family protein
LGAYFLQAGGCDLHEWYEGHVDPFVKSLFVDLRDAVWALKREKVQLRNAFADAVLKLEQEKKEIADLRMKLEQQQKESADALTKLEESKTEVLNKLEQSKREAVVLRNCVRVAVILAVAMAFMKLGWCV